MELKIESLSDFVNFLQEIKDAYLKYCSVISRLSDSSNASLLKKITVKMREVDFESDSNQDSEESASVRLTNLSVSENFKKLDSAMVESAPDEEILELQDQLNCTLGDKLKTANFISNLKSHSLKFLWSIQSTLRESLKRFELSTRASTSKMEQELKKLSDKKAEVEYLQHLKDPKGRRADQLSLLF